ncbi:MAG: C40 family peptidase [Candidatus Planktophila sp.]|nr:C40 family peptidase [Candidatus Planktophila sp.]
MKRVLALALIAVFMSQSIQAQAAPTVASVQRDVDRLRTLAAEKYEAANEATIRIRALQKETGALEQREAIIQGELNVIGKVLAKIAISEYQGSGFGRTFELLFSSDPTQYLSDASVLDGVSKGYAKQLREFAATKQRVQATQLVLADRTSQLIAEKKRLDREINEAKAALVKAEKLLKSLSKADRERLLREEAARENKILSDSKGYAASYKGDNTRGSIALKFALAQIGDIYVWAAAGPTRWDCSGLTMRAFQKAGVSLPHSSRVQVKYGKSIAYSNLKPGDLLFFGKPISHVSIYMGGGKMVQAPRPGKKVEVVPLTKMFGRKPFVAARRL